MTYRIDVLPEWMSEYAYNPTFKLNGFTPAYEAERRDAWVMLDMTSGSYGVPPAFNLEWALWLGQYNGLLTELPQGYE